MLTSKSKPQVYYKYFDPELRLNSGRALEPAHKKPAAETILPPPVFLNVVSR